MNDVHIIYDILDRRTAQEPEADAVVEGALRLSNQDLTDRVDAIARFLLAKGIKKGDRVATLAPPCSDFWMTFLATTSIGAIWQGLNPAYQHKEYTYLLADAQPALVFAHENFGGRDYRTELKGIASPSTLIIPLNDEPFSVDDKRLSGSQDVTNTALATARGQVDPEDISVIVYTSGTTGQPKGAMLSHRAVVQTALSNVDWMPKEGLQSTICSAPINHVGGLNNICCTIFAGGGRIIFIPTIDLDEWARVSVTELPSYLVASPTAWAMMLAAGTDFAQMSFYKLIVFGGAASSVAQLTEVQKTGAQLSSVYGQTETTGMFTFTDKDASLEAMSETIGKPIKGNDLRIATPAGDKVPLGEKGEIQVKGISVMSGYWNKPEATKETFTDDGWLKTGDLGYERDDGNIVFAGRLKEMFKSGGYNVYPVEVELAICEHPDVLEAAVIEVPHATFQEVGHAFLVLKPGASLTGLELKAYLKDRIAGYKIPKSWDFLSAFPRLPNSKVDKRALRKKVSADAS